MNVFAIAPIVNLTIENVIFPLIEAFWAVYLAICFAAYEKLARLISLAIPFDALFHTLARPFASTPRPPIAPLIPSAIEDNIKFFVSFSDLTFSVYNVFYRRKFFEAHRTARVELLVAYADLCSQSEFKSVRKSR